MTSLALLSCEDGALSGVEAGEGRAEDVGAAGDARPLEAGGLDGGSPPDVGEPDVALDAARISDVGGKEEAGVSPEPLDCAPLESPCAGLEANPEEAASRYPIVLVHGMGGFQNLGPLEYYFRVPRALREAGYVVYVPELDPLNSSDVRSRQLGCYLNRVFECTGVEKLNLIGHSQGGIDIRYLTAALGYGESIASVTTLATPHHGTAVADAMLGLTRGPSELLLDVMLALFEGVVYGPPEEDPSFRAALQSCSSPAMEAFNARWPDVEGVSYYSYAGFSGVTADGHPECDDGEEPGPRRGDVMAPELFPSFSFLGGPGVANDGLVVVESAKWGRFRGCIAADHMDQVGQLAGIVDSFDYRGFFLQLAGFLASEGH